MIILDLVGGTTLMDDVTEELKECPFCGSNCVNDTSDPEPNKHGLYYWVCPDCIALGPASSTLNEATKAWNSRKEPK